jgi:hypothetical protein
MKTTKIRSIFTRSHAQLRKARREYINTQRHAILQSAGNNVMHAAILEMIDSGLYAKPASRPKSERSFHDFRFSVARAIWQIEKEIWGAELVGQWHFWTNRNGFDMQFGRNLKQQKIA